MAKKSDYFGLGYLVSVILAIIPVTAWILGALTRLKEGKIVVEGKVSELTQKQSLEDIFMEQADE